MSLKIISVLLFCLISFLTSGKNTYAATLIEQTTGFSTELLVWQAIQELGSNLSGPAGSFTFRVSTTKPNSQIFDFTAQNTKIYDKDGGSAVVATGCATGNSSDRLRGLIFNTEGVPASFEDVTVDFTCNNYLFIQGHRYLIRISNANMSTKIPFGATPYFSSSTDYFTAGGLRYGNGNIFDIQRGGGSCNPVTYIWMDPIVNPVSGCYIWTSSRDDLYFKLTDNPPGMEEPEPFLELPWDYESAGLTFNEAALNINSYFDHEYPLLSSGLSESNAVNNDIISYLGPPNLNESYSSHDGYDYGRDAKANINKPVLAAADGIATFMNSCGACGNAILINHGNGYQTRYYHLQKDGLITSNGEEVEVSAGQQIGKVGATGNVFPTGEGGAHIHFMVVQDKNKDGNFEDNLPDGVTDPFGWQSREPDPWETFSFFYNGKDRTGNKSFYLWKKKLDNLDATLTSNGGIFKSGRYTVTAPSGITNQNLKFETKQSPLISITKSLVSVGTTIDMTARDGFGNLVTSFPEFFEILVDLKIMDLSRFKTSTLQFYSSSDGITWTPLETEVDLENKTAKTSVNHLTYFALVGERIDTIPPVTSLEFIGDKGQEEWFRSDVKLSLDAKDNEGGLGVDYTLYRINDSDWEIYNNPISLLEGDYKIEYYSVDNDENIEDVKSFEFEVNIDKISPETEIYSDREYIWSPTGKMIDVNLKVTVLDDNLYKTRLSIDDEYDKLDSEKDILSGYSGPISLEAKRDGGDLDGRLYIIKIVAEDLAGNITERQLEVIVPHDQR